MINAMIIDMKDNVGIAIEEIKNGQEINYKVNNEIKTIIATDDIKIYHKFSVKEIEKGSPVIKYGEHIGIASEKIEKGKHVHTHNVESHREEL